MTDKQFREILLKRIDDNVFIETYRHINLKPWMS